MFQPPVARGGEMPRRKVKVKVDLGKLDMDIEAETFDDMLDDAVYDELMVVLNSREIRDIMSASITETVKGVLSPKRVDKIIKKALEDMADGRL